jgi:hypothetical protein
MHLKPVGWNAPVVERDGTFQATGRSMIALSLLAKAVLRCGVLLQVRGDVGQVVEHL